MAQRILPRRLERGDTIAVIAPASPLSGMEAAYDRGRAFLEGKGFRVAEGRRLRQRHLLFAGIDRERAEDVNEVFADPAVKAVFCLRGGYGSARLLPFIDFDAIRSCPKVFVGYSDITALHIAIAQETGLVTFYGPMVATEMGGGRGNATGAGLFDLVSHGGVRRLFEGGKGPGVLTLSGGIGQGRLVGGCLSVVAATLGTRHEIDTRGAVLFLEDIDEAPHRVDRYLTQLIEAGKLDEARGLLFGGFAHCEYTARHHYAGLGVSLLDLVKDRLASFRKPCLWGLPFGHRRDAATLPIGAEATVDADRGTVTIDSPVL